MQSAGPQRGNLVMPGWGDETSRRLLFLISTSTLAPGGLRQQLTERKVKCSLSLRVLSSRFWLSSNCRTLTTTSMIPTPPSITPPVQRLYGVHLMHRILSVCHYPTVHTWLSILTHATITPTDMLHVIPQTIVFFLSHSRAPALQYTCINLAPSASMPVSQSMETIPRPEYSTHQRHQITR